MQTIRIFNMNNCANWRGYHSTQSRNLTIDFIRGIAVLLVVLGHNIQYGSGEVFYQSADYFEDFLFKCIYSFHMPLFALLSGYLFFWSLKKSVKDVLKRRMISLVLPIFCWVTLEHIGKGAVLAARNEFSFWTFIHHYVSSFVHDFWFLWAIFWCSMIVLLVEKWGKCEAHKSRVWRYGLIMLLALFAPTTLNAHMYAFMYPFFVAGFLFNKFNGAGWYKKYVKKDLYALAIAVIAFIVLFIFYSRDSYIYTTAISLLGKNGMAQIGIDIYRWASGLAGSLVVILVCKMISDRRKGIGVMLFVYFGQISLGIYILNSYVNSYVLKELTSSFSPNGFIWIVETIVSMVTYAIAVEIIRRIPITAKLLLGGR